MLFYTAKTDPSELASARRSFRSPWPARATLKLHNLPNLITALRILLTAPIIGLLLKERYGEALVLFFIAGLSDGIDGFLAKRYGWTSRLGGFLDPLADKLLLMGTILVLGWQGLLPTWLVMLVVLRDVVIVSGALSYRYLIGPFQAEPMLISKINTLFQLGLVLAVIFDLGAMPLPPLLLALGVYLTGLTTLLSGIGYVRAWGRRALQEARRTHAS